jgi:diguanylate cyclase (GGDEF)-like protein
VAVVVAVLVSLEGLVVGLLGPDGPSDVVLAWNAAIRLAFYLLVVWLVVTQKRLLEHLQHHAVTDPLTGVLNRRALYEAAERELARARRHDEPISVVYLDLDGLKEANDTIGHEAGDAMIVHVAQTARRVLRAEDLFARVGGDEFAAILPEAGPDEARQIVDRLAAGFAEHAGAPVRASFGVWTAVAPEDTIEDLLRHADQLMYEAKQAGGAGVRCGGPG